MYVGLWTPTRTYSCTVRGWPGSRNKNNTARAKEDTALLGNQPAVLLTSEEPSNEATTQRAHTVIPRGGSVYRHIATQVIRRIR